MALKESEGRDFTKKGTDSKRDGVFIKTDRRILTMLRRGWGHSCAPVDLKQPWKKEAGLVLSMEK